MCDTYRIKWFAPRFDEEAASPVRRVIRVPFSHGVVSVRRSASTVGASQFRAGRNVDLEQLVRMTFMAMRLIEGPPQCRNVPARIRPAAVDERRRHGSSISCTDSAS